MEILIVCFMLPAQKARRLKATVSEDTSSRISTSHMESIVEKLMMLQHRSSTARNYLSIWRQFNKFVLSLDRRPKLWEDRTTLFVGYLIDTGMQSSTVKSYVSAIKKTLVLDGYKWDNSLVLIRSLAKACRIINDKVKTRLPIHCGLLEMILFEIQRIYTETPMVSRNHVQDFIHHDLLWTYESGVRSHLVNMF